MLQNLADKLNRSKNRLQLFLGLGRLRLYHKYLFRTFKIHFTFLTCVVPR